MHILNKTYSLLPIQPIQPILLFENEGARKMTT